MCALGDKRSQDIYILDMISADKSMNFMSTSRSRNINKMGQRSLDGVVDALPHLVIRLASENAQQIGISG